MERRVNLIRKSALVLTLFIVAFVIMYLFMQPEVKVIDKQSIDGLDQLAPEAPVSQVPLDRLDEGEQR